jgi:hypothetical protein
MTTLRIVRIGEEDINFYLGIKHIAHVDHDNHGWIGMEAVEDALITCAKHMKWNVVFEELDEEDEADNN